MKTLSIIMAGALLTLSNAHARLGETEAQIEARYGKPKTSERSRGSASRAYIYRGFLVLVTFEGGVSRGEHYEKSPSALELFPADIGALLGANGGGGKWHQVPDSSADRLVLMVYRGAGGRIAMHNAVENSLLVTTEDFVARMQGQHAQELKGF